MEFNQCINFLLTKAQQTVYQYFKSRLAEYDVTPVQYGILSSLWLSDGQNPSQIASSLNLDSSTITGLLDRMENKELLKRQPDPEDRRALRVLLTKTGKELRVPLEKVVDECNLYVLEHLASEEQEQLKTLLLKINKKETSLVE